MALHMGDHEVFQHPASHTVETNGIVHGVGWRRVGVHMPACIKKKRNNMWSFPRANEFSGSRPHSPASYPVLFVAPQVAYATPRWAALEL